MKYDNQHIKDIAGYHLTQRIGSGGMGDVYKGYNAALNRTAAIKILHQKEMADRFRNEAYIQSSVSHPNIACLYEYLVTGETACIIMEYVEGETLDAYKHRKGKLTSGETMLVIKQIASALTYLHSRDILHRDIKPQNFKIKPDGTVIMLDFGISKNKYTPKLTQQGYMVGTTEYMAPEQFRQQVEKKSDIWSLGVLAYELVTGYMPFDANNPVTMRAKIEGGEFTKPVILVPEVSQKLNVVIEKCIQVNPSRRLSAQEVNDLLSNNKISAGVTGKNRFSGFLTPKTIGIAGVLILLIVSLIIFRDTSETNPEIKTEHGEQLQKNKQSSAIQKLTIDVPNTSNAYIMFQDGSTKKLPYELSGKEGEQFRFTLQADGYEPRQIEVPIKIGRKSYEYNLEKIKE